MRGVALTMISIQRIETILLDLPMIRPHLLAMTVMQKRTLLLVRVMCSDAIEGLGEATSIGGLAYGDESPEGVKVCIDTFIAPALLGTEATNINAAMELIAPSGFALFCPAMFGADPCTGSYNPLLAPNDADGSIPIDPARIPPTSLKISPNVFSVSITSNCVGRSTICMAALSTSMCSS